MCKQRRFRYFLWRLSTVVDSLLFPADSHGCKNICAVTNGGVATRYGTESVWRWQASYCVDAVAVPTVTKVFEFFFNSFDATHEISRIEIVAPILWLRCLGDKAGNINISYVQTQCGLPSIEHILYYGNYRTEEGTFWALCTYWRTNILCGGCVSPPVGDLVSAPKTLKALL
jgi:hypothetical protein